MTKINRDRVWNHQCRNRVVIEITIVDRGRVKKLLNMINRNPPKSRLKCYGTKTCIIELLFQTEWLARFVEHYWHHSVTLLGLVTGPYITKTCLNSTILKILPPKNENFQINQHSHSHFDLGVHVPLGLSIWGYRSLFEGTCTCFGVIKCIVKRWEDFII